ncbi:MAG: phasin family protein [Betaproteobacteria bacterium]|nr:phasin family protein [Betaproteobacteria bacterium]
MQHTNTARVTSMGEYVLTTSRQVWLAGLGAAVVTRDWAEKEAGRTFRTLVREGTAVESRAIRFVGDRLESSFVQANTAWKRTRRNVTTAVKSYADTAATLVRETLPSSLPKFEMPVSVKVEAKPATKRRFARAKKAAASRATAMKKGVKRTVKSAGKR